MVGVNFLHQNMKLTHTDLKPENILLKLDSKKIVADKNLWPVNVVKKCLVYPEIDDDGEMSPGTGPVKDILGCTGMKADSSEEPKAGAIKRTDKVWLRPLDD